MKRQSKQTGFSILGVVVAVVAVAAIGTAGWSVYQHNRVKPTGATGGTQTTNQNNNQQTTATPPANQTAVKIPELSIQITVPNEIKDLTYKTNTATLNDGRQETYALFSTTALTAIDAKCGTDFGPLGSLAKISGQYPTTFSDSNPQMNYGALVKQFPSFFISSNGPQGGCSENNAALDAMSKFKGDFQSAFSTIQALN